MAGRFRPLAHLTALRAFEAAARSGSFGAAALELDVTPGAVSRLIRQLEAAAGIRLFERLHRGIRLTGAGERLARVVAPAFDRLRGLGEVLAPQDHPQPIIVAAPATFLLRWLIPRQARLQAALGERQIATVTWDGLPDADAEHIAMFIGIGPAPPDLALGWKLHKLMPESFALVVHPDKLVPNQPIVESIARLPRLIPETRPHIWRDWIAEGGPDLPHAGERRLERMFFTLQAAEAGLGAAIAPVELVHDALRSGLLAAPLGTIARAGWHHLLVPPRAASSPQVGAAARWFRREAAAQIVTAPPLQVQEPRDVWIA